MNNTFTYDLDERKIKMILEHAELDYNEEVWKKFEHLRPIENKFSIYNSLPEIKINLGQTVFLPFLFILLIGGLSTLLFSFVNFKLENEKLKEIPLIEKTISNKYNSKHLNVIKKSNNIKKVISIDNTNNLVKNDKPIIEEKINPIVNQDIQSIDTKNVIGKNKITTKNIKAKRKQKVIHEELPNISTSNNLVENTEEPELELK
ncbi:MAG: hypothetical protein ACK504_03340 [Bacteroidota bacterium]